MYNGKRIYSDDLYLLHILLYCTVSAIKWLSFQCLEVLHEMLYRIAASGNLLPRCCVCSNL